MDALVRTLEGVAGEELLDCFNEAFSDYAVNVAMDLPGLRKHLVRNGYDPSISTGAWIDGRLAGFVLNGCRKWGDGLAAYDLGTGALPSARGQGVMSALASKAKDLMRSKGLARWVLEVLCDNHKAVRLYEKQGFKVCRDLSCLRASRDMVEAVPSWPVDRLSEPDWDGLEALWDFQPSWQNSTDSIKALADCFIMGSVVVDGSLAGYIVFNPSSGDIPQLAVGKDHRGRGVASSLLSYAASHCQGPVLKVNNVEAGQGLEQWLESRGLAVYARQYEMVLDLRDCKGAL